MKHKLFCKYRIAGNGAQYFYKSNELPTCQWMEDNIGKDLIDWRCYIKNDTSPTMKFESSKLIIEFKDEDKMVLFILKCGDNIEQM